MIIKISRESLRDLFDHNQLYFYVMNFNAYYNMQSRKYQDKKKKIQFSIYNHLQFNNYETICDGQHVSKKLSIYNCVLYKVSLSCKHNSSNFKKLKEI